MRYSMAEGKRYTDVLEQCPYFIGSLKFGKIYPTGAPSANGPMQVPSNATDSPTYASSSLVEDGGMTASTASSSSTTAAPVATSTAVADAPPLPMTTPMATPTTLFVKLNLIYYYYLFIYHYVDHANHAFLWRNWSLLDHFVLNLLNFGFAERLIFL